MNAIQRRIPAPAARRLLGQAGPPNGWVALAFVGAIAVAAVFFDRGRSGRLPGIIAAILVLAIPSILDRTGWRIRLGMSWLAAEQAKKTPRMPRTPAEADRWLVSASEPNLTFVRASVLLMAGRTEEARALINAAPQDEPEDRARAARMLAAIDGLERGVVDAALAEAAIASLPPERQRYHRLALAWSTAWVDALNGRRWQPAFAAASKGIRPSHVPRRYLAWHAVQELLAPLIGVAFGLFLMIVRVL